MAAVAHVAQSPQAPVAAQLMLRDGQYHPELPAEHVALQEKFL
jgi:hypothetical protein